MIKDHSNIAHVQSGYPAHSLSTTQPPTTSNISYSSRSITSNTELLEAYSKQALVSNDTDDPASLSSAEHSNITNDLPSNILTSTTGPLSAALINCHNQNCPNNHLTSNSTSHNIGSSMSERIEAEYDSLLTTVPTSKKEIGCTINDSPNDAPPIFRNVLHVAILYGKANIYFNSYRLYFHIDLYLNGEI